LATFYNWVRRGLVARVPFEYDTVRAPISADVRLLAHLHTGDGVPALDLTVREYRTIPTALSVHDLRRVRECLAPRRALITDWAVSTGARRIEVLGLTVNDIPDSHALRNTPFVAIPIIGKGCAQARSPGAAPDHRPHSVAPVPRTPENGDTCPDGVRLNGQALEAQLHQRIQS
jgi:hypothetical protein